MALLFKYFPFPSASTSFSNSLWSLKAWSLKAWSLTSIAQTPICPHLLVILHPDSLHNLPVCFIRHTFLFFCYFQSSLGNFQTYIRILIRQVSAVLGRLFKYTSHFPTPTLPLFAKPVFFLALPVIVLFHPIELPLPPHLQPPLYPACRYG